MTDGCKIKSLWADQSGATAIEYGLIAALIFLVIVAAVTAFSTNVTDMFNFISNTFTNNV